MRYDREDSEEEVIPKFYYLHEKRNAEPDIKNSHFMYDFHFFYFPANISQSNKKKLPNKKIININTEHEDGLMNQRNTETHSIDIFYKNRYIFFNEKNI